MASRTPGSRPDPAAELLGRWQAHHGGRAPADADQPTEEPSAGPDAPEPAGETEPGPSGAPDDDATDTAEDVPDGTPDSPPAAAAPRHAAPGPPAPTARTYDAAAAGREVVEALGIPARPEHPPAVAPTPARRRTTVAPAPGRSTDVVFPPRRFVQRLLGVLLLVLVPTGIGLGYLAYDQPTTLRVGVAATLGVLVLVLYGLRVSATPAHLAVRGGQLEVVRGQHRDVFDLTSRFTRLEVVGRPGRPGWKVLMARFGRDPLVIDASMVDPAAFMEALERHRPQARP